MSSPQLPPLSLSLSPGSELPQSARPAGTVGLSKTFQAAPATGRVPSTVRCLHQEFGFSSPRLNPLRDAWSQLRQGFVLLVETCELNRTFPLFVSTADQFTRVFKHFNRFAVTILNSPHPEGDPRSRLEQSGIWQSSRLVVTQWTGFIGQLNDVAFRQTASVIALIANAVDSVWNALADVADLFFVGSLKSPISPGLMNAISDGLNEIKRGVPSMIDRDSQALFDVDEYCEKVARAGSAIQAVFLGRMPRCTTTTTENMLQRMQLKIELQELHRLVNGLATFDGVMGNLRQCCISLNEQMAQLMRALGLPWKLVLHLKGSQELKIEHEVAATAARESIPQPRRPRRHRPLPR
jgi:hypothetical protein